MIKLNDYKTLKNELLKEWSEKDFEDFKTLCYYSIKSNLQKNVKYTAGQEPNFDGMINRWTKDNELERVFGLPFTSSSSYAALWVTNTQCETRNGKKLKFISVAMNINKKPVLIFEDEKEEHYYFEEYSFNAYAKEQEEIKSFYHAAQFNKNANAAHKIIIEILKKYNGRAYGEKTKEKIQEEIREATKILNVRAYLTTSTYDDQINIITDKGERLEHVFYTKFLKDNKIIEPEQKSNMLEEFDPLKTFLKLEKLAKEIKEQSQKLLINVEELNTLNRIAHKENKDTQTFNYKLYSVAKYGVK